MTASSLIPLARIAAFDEGGYVWLLIEMLITLAIIGVVAWLVLRWAGSHRPFQGGPISVLARHTIEPRRTLYLVSVGDRVLLLGSSEAGLTTLAELSPDEVPSDLGNDEPPSDFAAKLAARLLARGPRTRAGEANDAAPTPHDESGELGTDASATDREVT